MRVLFKILQLVFSGAMALALACGGGGSSSGGNSSTASTPSITSFAANPSTVTVGGTSALTGVFANGTGIITPGNLSVASGTVASISPTATTIYTLTVTNASGAEAHQTASVTVVPAPVIPVPTISSFTASPASIPAGGNSVLIGVFANGTGVITPGNLTAISGTAVSVGPATTTTYTLTVANAEGSNAMAQVTVAVPTSASALIYTDPTDPSSWRLVRDSASTSTHLVLDLLAPIGLFGQGVTMILTADTTEANWSFVSGTAYLAQAAYPNAMVSIASINGNSLRIVVSQAAGAPVAAYGSAPVLSVALDLVSGASPGNVAVSVAQGGHLGLTPTPSPITIEIGVLKAQ